MLGLLVLKNKIKLNNLLNKYFTNQYFMPNIQLKLTDQDFKICKYFNWYFWWTVDWSW